jgi:hypothetical protein
MNRFMMGFNFIYNYRRGSLWRIKESLWKERLVNNNYKSDRIWHPGLSIKKNRIVESLEKIPMLHGSSKGSKKKSIIVKGISKEGGKDKKTYFGRLIAPIYMSDFTGNKKPENKRLVVWELDTQPIVANHHKPHITDEEMNQLDKWMREKGIS